MTQQTIEIDGLPEGWKAVAYRCPESGDYYLENNGIVIKHTGCKHKFPLIIVEKIQPRRIVLEETAKENELDKFGDPIMQHFGNGIVVYSEKIWKEVKE